MPPRTGRSRYLRCGHRHPRASTDPDCTCGPRRVTRGGSCFRGFAALNAASFDWASMAVPVPATAERIGDLLMREGLITREQLDRALQEQKQNGTRVGYNLVKLGFVQETEITRMLARQYRMPAVDLSKFDVDPRIAKLIPTDLATKHLVLPLKRDGRTLTVAMADPTNIGVIDDLKFITRYDIFPVIAGEYTLRAAIEKYYESSDMQMSQLLKEVEGSTEDGDVEVVADQEEEMSAAAL